VPRSYALVERLIGTERSECLDRVLFWTATDLKRKLVEFQHYYNEHRTHAGRAGRPPGPSPHARVSLQALSVASTLSWAVAHAEGRVTARVSAFAPAIYEFATHRWHDTIGSTAHMPVLIYPALYLWFGVGVTLIAGGSVADTAGEG
jgi:hypothetical protein